MQTTHVDVLIVGGGPAGLLCAIALNKVGHNVKIIDKRVEKLVGGRADGLMSRTLEVLQSYELMDHLFQEGSRMFMAAFYAPAAEGIQFIQRGRSVDGPRARWHYEVTLNQGMIEVYFENVLLSKNISVERPSAPESVEISTDEQTLVNPQSHAVKTIIRSADGTLECVHAKYVIGADGANSWVRSAVGLSMEGEDTGQVWGVVDFVPHTNFPDFRNRAILMAPDGTCLLIPREDNKIRIYVQLDHRDQYAKNKETNSWTSVQCDEILKLACGALKPFEMSAVAEPQWWSIFRVEQKVASSFSVQNRVFIVGDACHTHSPQAGQGLNAGMNDAHNLVWKLSQVLRGHANASLLQTYEDERRAFAKDLIKFDKIISDLRGKQGLTSEERKSLQEAGSTFVTLYSGIGIRYAKSSVVSGERQDIAHKLVLGERMHPATVVRAADGWPHNVQDLLPSDARYKVLVFAGNITEDIQLSRVRDLSKALATPFWRKNSNTEKENVLDILAFAHGVKSPVDAYTTLKAELSLDWTKIFVDAEEACAPADGHVHSDFGIGSEGAIVVVRPDGYVAAIAHCDARAEAELAAYFHAFAV